MSVTQEIKNRLDIVDIISDHVPLRKSGRNFSGFCPFHQNTRSPAFYVFPETQTWRCFGACAEGGDIFSFVMKREGLDFRESLEQLASRAGVTLEPLRPVNKKQQAAAEKQSGLLEAAADYFHMLLLHAPEGKSARNYVAQRQFTDETLATYRLGFALESWNACRNHFNDQGYDDQDLIDAGLLTVNEEKDRRYDRFRNRLMIPIRDVSGQVVGFGARTLDPDGIPKYLNSPQTAMFDKSRLLYGLDLAKRHIREARQVVIVEGYMDVMQGWQQGHRNIVAQMGTALTESQLRLLKRYTKRLVLALDADAAGAKATMRGLQVARETLDHDVDVRFDARGLVRHESRLQADIHVVTLPEGNDPDKIMRTNPEMWAKLVTASKPVVAYVIDVLTQELDPRDAKAKTAVAQQVIPLIKDIGDPVERDHYWQHLARALQTDERALRQVQLPPPRRQTPLRGSAGSAQGAPKAATMTPPPTTMPGHASHNREQNFLRQCLAYPRLIERVNKLLTKTREAAVTAADFEITEDKLLWEQLLQGLALAQERGAVVDPQELWDSLDDPILESRLQILRTVPPTPQTSLERLPDTLALSVLQWRQYKMNLQSREIKQLVLNAADQNDLETLQLYQEQAYTLSLRKREMDKAIASMSAVNRRRAADNKR